MKKWPGKILLFFVTAAASVAAVLIGIYYFHFISQRIYEDSAVHLEEIYGQVNHSLGAFISKNWGLLDSWDDYLASEKDAEESDIYDFINEKRAYWGFSEFYFLSYDGTYITLDGTEGIMDLGEAWDSLMEQKNPVMSGGTLSTDQDVTIFAIPVQHGKYKNVTFNAIAISYTNADIADSLNVDAFFGKAACFVIHDNGNVLLSTQPGGNVFENYLVYLNAASDLNKKELKQIGSDWENGKSGLLQCKIGGVNHYILYQPVKYQDYILLSVVPQNAVSAGFLSIQKATVCVLIIIFLIISTLAIALIVLYIQKQSRRNKTELAYRESMFNVLSNCVDDIFLMLNIHTQKAEYISPNIERLLGIPAAEAKQNIRIMEKCAINYNIVIPEKELEAIPLGGSRFWECEYMHQNTGERRWYRMTVYHLDIQNVKKHIIVLSDRTLEQQTNHQLQEALTVAKSANEAKSNFLSNMSHDIRTPMNAIVGFSVLLEKDADKPEKVLEYTRKITASSHHLLSLINDVLDMSKIESGKTSLNVDLFHLPQFLEELNIILMPQAKAKKQSFEIHVQGSPPEKLMGDKLRLNQILINLLSNAIKYTPENGQVTFQIVELPQPTQQYTKLRFIVQDNGIGMSEEFIEQIFTPFSREISSVTNKIQGTGLGMAITKNLVDLMGGIIQVESQPGEGSTFTVELSFALPEQEQTDSEPWFHNSITRILVADDEEEICLDIKEMLKSEGMEAAYATNGAAAVEAAVLAHQSGKDFDIILLDWKMPEMNGVETARNIRMHLGSDVPILVLTSYDWAEIEEEAREAGINAFMQKPFFVSAFQRAVRPLFHVQTAETPAEPEPADETMKGRLFLVVEDNELNAEILTEMLDMEEAKCELAVNGSEAVEMFEKSKPGYYDMILMDVQMPVMNGYEATRKIRSSHHPDAKNIPIVAMTANTFAEDVRNAMDAGMDGHLAKPIDMDTVRDLIGKLIGRKQDT